MVETNWGGCVGLGCEETPETRGLSYGYFSIAAKCIPAPARGRRWGGGGRGSWARCGTTLRSAVEQRQRAAAPRANAVQVERGGGVHEQREADDGVLVVVQPVGRDGSIGVERQERRVVHEHLHGTARVRSTPGWARRGTMRTTMSSDAVEPGSSGPRVAASDGGRWPRQGGAGPGVARRGEDEHVVITSEKTKSISLEDSYE
ncbi:hypothetical protein EJB05_48008, partial [Eragrostis curvula]